MRKRYTKRGSVRKAFREQRQVGQAAKAREVQLTLNPEEVLAMLQDSMTDFATEMGLRVARLLLDDEVNLRCGLRYERAPERTVTRYGRQQGVVVIAGQKLPEKVIEIMRGGWQGHGRRPFAGWIHHDSIVPFRTERLTVGMRNTLQDLALDPQGVAKAMAQRLSACMYCGQRLSDQESKERGYGPVCAGHWGQPWGTASNKPIDTQFTDNLLEELFAQ